MTDRRLAHEEELFKLAGVTAVATAGGTVALLVSELTPIRFFFALLGSIVTLILAVFMVSKDIEIKRETQEERI